MKSRKQANGFGMVLIAIGIVYGDIGTSPMYVMKSLLAENGGIGTAERPFILGSLSLIIWTITLLTTVKYVVIAMKADNHGEGGIFALYSLVRRYGKWLIFPAMIGGAALLADGVLTPAVTVTTAVEGLRSIGTLDEALGNGTSRVILITLAILAVLFLVQRAGTSVIGRAFGPVMLVWFLFLGSMGIYRLGDDLTVLEALNPVWAVRVLTSPYNKQGFMILGSVFLAATGAEALYSDMGHVGKTSIYRSWPFVKLCLILNYLGQGAWILQNRDDPALGRIADMNPFFQMLPVGLRPAAVILGAAAAVIASQALITGSFTLVSEAIRLNLMPHMRITYPSENKGQLYISLVNTIIWIGCSGVVLYFKSSARMEAAYGLAITLTMLMTTLLLVVYLWKKRKNLWAAVLVGGFFGSLEMVFFLSSLGKFPHGGYVAALLALLLFLLMESWYRGTRVELSQSVQLKMRDYLPQLEQLKYDESIPKITDNMVFITNVRNPEYVDRDILYSILDKNPKRASAYWLIHIHVTEEPYTRHYRVENYGTDFVFHVTLELGFRVNQRINVFLRQIVTEMMDKGELPVQEMKYSIYGASSVGGFRFCMIRKTLTPENDLAAGERRAVEVKHLISKAVGSPAKWYGLENTSLWFEYVPLFVKNKVMQPLTRV